jgi:hypothetical protein
MSKRYGRNQKRAHRTRIAELEKHIADLQKQNDGLWRSNRDLSDEIACAKRIVGEYCVAFQPRSMTMSFRQTDFVTIIKHEQDFNSGVSRYWDFRQDPFMQPMRIEQIRLPIMCALAHEDLRGTRHVVATYDGKAYGYAIDAMAWRQGRYPEALCRQIAERFTHHIYEEMRRTTPTQEPRRTHTRHEPEPQIRSPRFEFNPLPDFLR